AEGGGVMIADLMLYALATGALLAFAARAAEEVLRPYRLPLRWVWVAALLGSIALPAASWATGGSWPGGVFSFGRNATPAMNWLDFMALAAEGSSVDAAAAGESAWLDGLRVALLVAWLAASLLALIGYGWTWSRVRRERASWRAAELAGASVLVAPRDGPVVIGFRKPAIVVPEWLLSEPPTLQQVVVIHEREHLRARDHALLAMAPLAAMAAPWNLPVWWILRRLRLAVELDCDRRVLGHGIAALAYGSVLLDVAGRGAVPSFAAAALAEPRTFLERRILAMTSVLPARRFPRALAFGVVTAVAVALSCETAGPTNVSTEEPETKATTVEAAATARIADIPVDVEVRGPEDRELLVEDVVVRVDGKVITPEVLENIDFTNVELIEIGGERIRLFAEGPGPMSDADKKKIKGLVRAALERAKVTEITLEKRGKYDAEVRDERAVLIPKILLDPSLPPPPPPPPPPDGAAAADKIKMTYEQLETLKQSEASEVRVPMRITSENRVAEGRVNWPPSIAVDQTQQPIVYIDGHLVAPSEINRLDPSQIESVEVLKGPAALRNYGEHAVNGVILITTKR
ncbi:MAG: M56 family metallopeptidase, partial [Longimicrobiales bacterium]